MEAETRHGHGFLRDEKGCYCALGLLCDVVDPQGWEDLGKGYIWRHRGKIGFPVLEVLSKAGLSMRTASYIQCRNDARTSLGTMAALVRKLPRRPEVTSV